MPAQDLLELQVLVIDDERNIRKTLEVCLEGLGCSVTSTGSVEAALAALSRRSFDLALLDLRLGDASGMDLLPRLLALQPDLAVVVITAFATFDTAVDAVKRGALDYVAKPFTPPQIAHVVNKVRERKAMVERVATLESTLATEVPAADFSTESPAMRAAFETLGRAAPSTAPVLIRGENGTGKGVFARALHSRSPRRGRPFTTVSCPTLSGELLASELFGHVQGAFTGAVRDQAGRVETAEGGTLFLDEIGEVSPVLQSKLLRFVQEHEFERIGETRTRRADVRLLAATNRNLEEDVTGGRFREDLLYRLNVIEVTIPALRDRREDILRLARRFLDFFGRAAGRPQMEISPDAEQVLLAYPWPGNVRELRNTIERAVILWPARLITPEALPDRLIAHGTRAPQAPTQGTGTSWVGRDFTLEQIEREHVLGVMRRSPTLEDAARILGIDASTLWRKRKKYEES